MLRQTIGTLSGGQRRRVELARILFSGVETLLLDEPTNHFDADSIIWLREYLKSYSGGLIVISHDVDLLRAVVNKVFHLDANRAQLDQYAMGWDVYLSSARPTRSAAAASAPTRRRRPAAHGASRQDARQGHQGRRRAEHGAARRADAVGLEAERVSDKVAHLRFPEPAPCGKTPLTAAELSKSYGSLEVFTDVDLAIDRGSKVVVLGLNGAGKTTLLRILGGVEESDTGEIEPGHGLKLGYYAQEHETLDMNRRSSRT